MSCVLIDFVTDFDFSPFDDYLLSTCSQDGTVSTAAYLSVTNIFQTIRFVPWTIMCVVSLLKVLCNLLNN